jgi:hypothetical protein
MPKERRGSDCLLLLLGFCCPFFPFNWDWGWAPKKAAHVFFSSPENNNQNIITFVTIISVLA